MLSFEGNCLHERSQLKHFKLQSYVISISIRRQLGMYLSFKARANVLDAEICMLEMGLLRRLPVSDLTFGLMQKIARDIIIITDSFIL